MRALLFVAALVLAGAGAAAFLLTTRAAPVAGDLQLFDHHFRLPRVVDHTPQPMRTIFLNRAGATLSGGTDDSTQGRSSVVADSHRDQVTIPPFRGSTHAWERFVACMRHMYEPFGVEVVDERPAQRGYIMTVVGGTPSILGMAHNISGLAPFNGDPIEDAVVFVFSRAVSEDQRLMCETAAMETAHAYGLDHEFLCRDPMTYLPYCGAKSFQNRDAQCGEHRPRPCEGGATTQNSFARLLSELGAHSATAVRHTTDGPAREAQRPPFTRVLGLPVVLRGS